MADSHQFLQFLNGLVETDGLVSPNYGSAPNTVAQGNDGRLSITNVVRVKANPGPGEFALANVQAAIDSITTATSTNPFLVTIGPGIVPGFTTKSFVGVRGSGQDQTVVDGGGNDAVTGADNSWISDCLITGATTTDQAGVRYVSLLGTTRTSFFVMGCRFGENDLLVSSDASTAPSAVFVENCKFGADYSFRRGFVVANGGRIIIRNSTSTSLASPLPEIVFFATGTGSEIVINAVQCRSGTMTPDDCIHIQDGASLRSESFNASGFGIALHVGNTGAAPSIEVVGQLTENCTLDLQIDHPGTTGTFQGSATLSKVSINPDATVAISYLDTTTGNLIVAGRLLLGNTHESVVDVSTLIIETSPMGLLEGGKLSDGGGLTVNVASGFGYLELEPEILRRFDWGATSIAIPANSSRYVFINSSGMLTSDAALPDTAHTILLGRAVTVTSDILFIDGSASIAEHASNSMDLFNRRALGPVYETGSIVTESGTRNLDVTGGSYFFSTNHFVPSGGTAVTWMSARSDGLGDFVYANQTVVDNAFFDDGSGTLAPLTAGFFAKHSLYVVGDDGGEKYFLTYSQTQYATLVLAEGGNIPLPPPSFIDAMVLIGSIIVQEGVSAIVEIRDERPVIGFKAGGVSASSDHGNLTGLLDDDHPQYLKTDGSRALTGDLDMGGNDLTNVGSVDGIDVNAHASRHLPNGADPLTTAAPGANLTANTTNATGIANSLARSDHSHAISTGVASALTPNQSSSAGTAASLSRSDHIHNIATAAAVALTPDQANADGVATTFSKSDHVHNIATGTAVGLDASSTNTQGSAATFSRADHTHAIASGTPSTQNATNTNTTGTSTNFARADHLHTITTGAASSQTPDQANATGTSASLARADHVHSIATASAVGLSAGSTNTQGSAATFSRADHTHAIASGTPSTQIPDQANAAGTSTNFARADHIHTIAAATPVTLGTVNAKGSATSFALSDHVHAHGAQTDDSLHALATTGANGFMSAADKAKLDAITGTRDLKSGVVLAGSFSGNPKKATVTFSTAFASTAYSITITGTLGRTWTYESKLAGSFVINANANAALTGEVSWTAIQTGESTE